MPSSVSFQASKQAKEKLIQAKRFQIEIDLISSLKMSSTTEIDDPFEFIALIHILYAFVINFSA